MAGISWAVVATVVVHDGNPVLELCISNVVSWYDARTDVYPGKSRPEQKTDAAVSLIMAIARCLAAKPARSVYETRGIQFVGGRGRAPPLQ